MKMMRRFFTRSRRNGARNFYQRSNNCSRPMGGTWLPAAVIEWNKTEQVMNTIIIIETARKTLAGTISFPEVVGQLLAAGVEYYHVDYAGMRKTFYDAEGGMVVTP